LTILTQVRGEYRIAAEEARRLSDVSKREEAAREDRLAREEEARRHEAELEEMWTKVNPPRVYTRPSKCRVPALALGCLGAQAERSKALRRQDRQDRLAAHDERDRWFQREESADPAVRVRRGRTRCGCGITGLHWHFVDYHDKLEKEEGARRHRAAEGYNARALGLPSSSLEVEVGYIVLMEKRNALLTQHASIVWP